MNVSNYLLTNKCGCWIANGIPFASKLAALNYSSQSGNSSVSFYYYDHIWQNFDRVLLGKVPLEDLYKERALQLRNKYDYLILHYSGGSDSHNILHTFITNNIKLDEIFIRWPKHWIDGKFYNVNNIDTSANNAPSEFNYTIAPVLDYLKTYHPNIKINIVDFTEKLLDKSNIINLEKKIIEVNSSRSALCSIVQRLDDDRDTLMFSSYTENIGHVFGVEKPLLFLKDNNLYFYFSDVSFDTISMHQDLNAEPFYWTSDLPLLTMEQIYQVGLFFKNNKQHLNLLPSPNKTTLKITKEINLQQNLLKSVLYKLSWNFNKFQVDKPNIDRSDWHSWIYQSNELSMLRQNFLNLMLDITSGIDSRFLIYKDKTPLLDTQRTKLFHLMDLS